MSKRKDSEKLSQKNGKKSEVEEKTKESKLEETLEEISENSSEEKIGADEKIKKSEDKKSKKEIKIPEPERLEKFFRIPESKAPVLSQVAVAPQPRITNLESEARQSQSPNQDDEKGDFSYLPKNSGRNSEDKKYLSYNSNPSQKFVRKEEIEKSNRNLFPSHEVSFNPTGDRGPEKPTFESYTPAKKFDQRDFENDNKNPLQNKEVKYKPSEY